MLRLTVVSQTSEEMLVKVEGWLDRASIEVMTEEGQRWREQSHHLVLDIEELKGIDAAGLMLLEKWVGDHLELRGGSCFIQALLKRHHLM